MEPELQLTMEQIAYVLGVSRNTIYNRQRTGELPAGAGLDVVRAAFAAEEQRLEDMRGRLSEVIADSLIVAVSGR